ncbi:YccF domain-containing protein [Cytophagales bacterium LB-30]|uniref:YccF domain-containing protein n=1 Tax=Shiella aurantiaca TaxID=3058365 RepID=A0ABT8F8E4_9BACT|nr:YccF domain-containing protein [Shiella aurantiaca]MDN4166658.1 YccF domain-containing protein [Shiella aurantiaca]
MNTLGNLIWMLFGGLLVALEYMIASFVLCLTIIGIPFGLQSFKLAALALWPFGKQVRETPGSGGCLSLVMNILWIFCGGIWICLTHLFFGIILGITIIGIPFAKQHFKLAVLAFTPFGKEIITKD